LYQILHHNSFQYILIIKKILEENEFLNVLKEKFLNIKNDDDEDSFGWGRIGIILLVN